MSPKDPERLRVTADSPLAREALASAAEEAPSPELSQRMAKALGVSAAAGASLGVAAVTARAAAKAATTASASTPVVPWIAVGAVVAVVVGGAVVGTRAWRRSAAPSPVPAVVPARSAAPPAVEPPSAPAPAATAEQPAPAPTNNAAPSGRRGRPVAHPVDLREQTLLIDGARAAMARESADKALSLVREYHERYPAGVFAPEAAALKIEALVRLGRDVEARALAERFVATQPPGPLSERVKAVARLPRP